MSRLRRVAVVYCHPLEGSFAAAMRDTVVSTLEGDGHEVRVRDLYSEGFCAELDADEHAVHRSGAVARPHWEEIERYAGDLRWCDTLVLVYPTWWGGLPAMLKGWVDRVWVNGVAWELPDGETRIRARLRNIRRIVAVTAHGSSKWVNIVEGESGKHTVRRQLRMLCHPLARSTWLALYGIDRSTPAQRAAFLDRIERRLRRL